MNTVPGKQKSGKLYAHKRNPPTSPPLPLPYLVFDRYRAESCYVTHHLKNEMWQLNPEEENESGRYVPFWSSGLPIWETLLSNLKLCPCPPVTKIHYIKVHFGGFGHETQPHKLPMHMITT